MELKKRPIVPFIIIAIVLLAAIPLCAPRNVSPPGTFEQSLAYAAVLTLAFLDGALLSRITGQAKPAAIRILRGLVLIGIVVIVLTALSWNGLSYQGKLALSGLFAWIIGDAVGVAHPFRLGWRDVLSRS